ncbi:MAG: S41 family peptidase [Acidobacteria bacterium]|nr:S41 family peptidase [Acidobacteriota bacterium]
MKLKKHASGVISRLPLGFLAILFLLHASLAAAELNEAQRLAGLCRVWGLLKYYHNNVSGGRLDWNQELLEMIPGVKAAGDGDAYQQQLLQLLRKAGYAETYSFLVPAGAFANVDWRWLDDAPFMSPLLAALLKGVRDSHDPALQYYYEPQFDKGSLEFQQDKKMLSLTWEREEVRLLALFSYWNVIEYFAPNRNLMDRPWDETLLAFIPRFQAAATELDFQLLVKELAATLHDSHAWVYSPMLDDFFCNYKYKIGFDAAYIEEQTVVTCLFPRLLQDNDIRLGDVVTHINGKSTAAIRAELRKYINASNDAYLQRSLTNYLFTSASPAFQLTIERDGQVLDMQLPGVPFDDWLPEYMATVNGRVPFAMLEDNIGYIHMGSLKGDQVADAMSLLKDAQAIVFDVRCYPQGTIWGLNNYLNEGARPWAKFFYPLPQAPGYFGSFTTETGPAKPNPDRYKGRIVVLTNERTLSQAEFTCMALQATGRATLIGSQTAGADGDISTLHLPALITTNFTGMGVHYPDGRPTQGIGIVPDIECRPTIAGVRAGRDEVLERALRFIATGN